MNQSGPGALFQAAVGGNDRALTALVRAYHRRAYGFGLRVCRDSFDAEDAVQEAFLKLARRPDVQKDVGALSWILTVVRNLCLRMLRRFARDRSRFGEGTVPADEAVSAAPTPEAAFERWRVAELVHEAIEGLAPEYREVLVLRDIEGLPGDEVCRSLRLSEAAMKSRLHRARSSVRAHLLRFEELAGRPDVP